MNQDISAIFERIALFLEIKGDNIFKIKAYQRAAENISALAEDVADLKEQGRLGEVPGIGPALKEKITEFIDTGKIPYYEELKKEIPESLLELVRIPSVGPKKAALFWAQQGISTIDQLEAAAISGQLLTLPGVQEKTIENILRGIRLVKQGQERMNLGWAHEIADVFLEALKKLPEVKKISLAGSLRRMKETIRDIDILIVSPKPQKVMDHFINLPQVKTVLAQGETKSSILTKEGIQVDLRVVDAKVFGSALLYFTGSKNFNVKIRQVAIKKEMKVSEYGIFSLKGDKERFLCGETEEHVLETLSLPFIAPELREDIGEEELFSGKPLPRLIELKDICGDLQMHSTWSDGVHSIEQMAAVSKSLGYGYIAITDHSPKLRVANGVSVADLKKKRNEIDLLNKRLKGFRILFGSEVEIDLNGDLDYNEKVLSEFDFVIAAIHSGFEQSKERQTARLIKACRNKHVHAIAHPTGVHLGKREAFEVDMKEFCKAAVDHNVYLEINSFPVRLDLNSQNVYFARRQGVKFVINTDSHSSDHLRFMKYGVAVGRRGWLEAKDVLNTLSLEKMLKAISKK